ncbi:MAG: SCO family protein [Pseudomonadota bacterium]
MQRIGLILLSVLAVVAGITLSRWMAAPASTLAMATAYPQPRPLPAFALVDDEGAPFTREHIEGRWRLLFFGFTHCPDVCPLTLSTLSQAVAPTSAQDAPAAQIVLVSVDPERDTPERMAAYVARFGEDVVGVTGSAQAIADFAAAAAIAYGKVPLGDDGEYTVDHSAAVLVVDPEGRIAAVFNPPPPLVADTIRQDLAVLKRLADQG